MAILRLTGTLTGSVIITSSTQGFKYCENLCSGAYNVYITNSVGNALLLPQGQAVPVIFDATNGARNAVSSPIPTGVPMPYLGTTAPSGFVLGSGKTIGSASSGATERANADTNALFTLLWNLGNTTAFPISGGYGASASADWSANKAIGLPDLRGRSWAGIDNLGGSGAGRLNWANAIGTSGGEQYHALTAGENGPHNHSALDSGHSHGLNLSTDGQLGYPGLGLGSGGSFAGDIVIAAFGNNLNSLGGNANISVGNSGSGAGHNTMQPTFLGSWIIKL